MGATAEVSPVAGGLVTDTVNGLTTFMVPKGLIKVEGWPAFMFESMAFSLLESEERSDLQATLQQVIGPARAMTAFIGQFSDVGHVAKNTLFLGLVREDKTTLWIRIPNVVLTEIGVSYLCEPKTTEQETVEFFMSTQFLSFMSRGEVTLAASDPTLVPITDEQVQHGLCMRPAGIGDVIGHTAALDRIDFVP